MSLSQASAANLVPILARIVLACAFIPAGWNKLMTETEFTGDDARRLRELNVAAATPDAGFTLVSWQQESQPKQEEKEKEKEAAAPPSPAAASAPPAAPVVTTPPAAPAPAVEPPAPPAARVSDPALTSDTPVRARSLHGITLMVDGMGGSYPRLLGWLAALTELIGGGLALIGLLTRFAGLALAVIMGVAFYMTTMTAFLETWIFGMDIPTFNRFIAQTALFALAFGLIWTGAGAVSFDRALFRRKTDEFGIKNDRDPGV